MTLKRDKKREIVRKQLMEKEQESTHSLVSKFSKEMLNLIQTKEREVLVSLDNYHALCRITALVLSKPLCRECFRDASVSCLVNISDLFGLSLNTLLNIMIF